MSLAPGDKLFVIGDTGTCMHIIRSGSLACFTREGAEVKVLDAGTGHSHAPTHPLTKTSLALIFANTCAHVCARALV